MIKITRTEAGRVRNPAWIPSNNVLVGVAQGRDVEYMAQNPGDWMLHCHMFHHMMNFMSVITQMPGGGPDRTVGTMIPRPAPKRTARGCKPQAPPKARPPSLHFLSDDGAASGGSPFREQSVFGAHGSRAPTTGNPAYSSVWVLARRMSPGSGGIPEGFQDLAGSLPLP